MHQQFKELAKQAGGMTMLDTRGYGEHNNGIRFSEATFDKFTDLMIDDILKVVAAHVLSGDNAVDVFANLKRIYKND